MISGAFKFILAIIVAIVVGIVINPIVAVLFNGFTLSAMAVVVCQILAGGAIVATGK